MNLSEGMKELAGERRRTAKLKEAVRRAEDVLHNTVAWADFKDAQDELKAQEHLLEGVENGVRLAIITTYHATGSKKPVEGAGIRIVRHVRYDLAAALGWAIQNAQNLLVLDTKRFEKGVIDGVLTAPATVEEEATATIATDLSALLED